MIDLDSRSLQIVCSILREHLPGFEVKVFGSRVTGKAKPFSDLDLVIISKKPVSIEKMNELKFAFSNSDLPIMVDVVDWYTLSETFRRKIEANCEILVCKK